MPNYGDPKYWEERYKSQRGTTFDWLEDYETLKGIINELKLPKDTCNVLNLGCGNSEFCENMYQDGYKNIYNVDISENCIYYMKERNKDSTMAFDVMDVRDMKFPDNTFDLAVDKSTMDAILCGEKSFMNVAVMTKEVQRVLKEGGVYMIISYGQPENRILHLEREHLNFEITIYTIKKDYTVEEDNQKFEKMHYVYLCKKRKGADEICKKNFGQMLIELEKEEKFEEEYFKVSNKIVSGEPEDENIMEEEVNENSNNYEDDVYESIEKDDQVNLQH